MFHHLEGELVVLEPARAVVEASGVGYELRIPLSTYEALKGRQGSRVRLLAHLQVLEDDHRLYGFASEKERALFRIITSVSGVGPGIALSLLASFDAPRFASVIAGGDARALRGIKGVGPKLSERMLFELKDLARELSALAGEDGAVVPGSVTSDAVAALVAMGFARGEADRKVESAVRKLLQAPAGDSPPGKSPPGKPAAEGRRTPTVEEVIRAAMQARDN